MTKSSYKLRCMSKDGISMQVSKVQTVIIYKKRLVDKKQTHKSSAHLIRITRIYLFGMIPPGNNKTYRNLYEGII